MSKQFVAQVNVLLFGVSSVYGQGNLSRKAMNSNEGRLIQVSDPVGVLQKYQYKYKIQ